jgi:hypothetical protein
MRMSTWIPCIHPAHAYDQRRLNLNDRIFVPTSKALKAKYKKHASKVHGTGLAAWVRQLMKQDYVTKEWGRSGLSHYDGQLGLARQGGGRR